MAPCAPTRVLIRILARCSSMFVILYLISPSLQQVDAFCTAVLAYLVYAGTVASLLLPTTAPAASPALVDAGSGAVFVEPGSDDSLTLLALLSTAGFLCVAYFTEQWWRAAHPTQDLDHAWGAAWGKSLR